MIFEFKGYKRLTRLQKKELQKKKFELEFAEMEKRRRDFEREKEAILQIKTRVMKKKEEFEDRVRAWNKEKNRKTNPYSKAVNYQKSYYIKVPH